MLEQNDTICAIATRLGGALGVIRVSGPKAIEFTQAIFTAKSGKPLAQCRPYSIVFGTVYDRQPAVGNGGEANNSNGQDTPTDSDIKNSCRESASIVDEVLVSVFHAPHSYTGEDSTELSCHGSPYILQRITSLLIQAGCRQAAPGEYTQRAFMNGKMDLSQAESVADLIASDNASAHRIAMQQMRGGYSRKLAGLRDQLLELTSLLELELDFSEEDVEFAQRDHLRQLAMDIQAEIKRLADSFSTGNALKNGVPVAIIGAPNVGKSTLLNALLGDDRAIVSEIQGTTRDLIEDSVVIDGVQFRFIDTAGIRHTNDSIEQMGIERSLKAAAKARIVIMLTEPGVPYPDIPTLDGQTVLRIENKTPQFQALTGIGLDALRCQLVSSATNDTTDRDILVTNLRHYESLQHAHASITRAIASMDSALSGDLIAEDLRQCIAHLSDILGSAITPSDVLQNIFSRFCIGK